MMVDADSCYNERLYTPVACLEPHPGRCRIGQMTTTSDSVDVGSWTWRRESGAARVRAGGTHYRRRTQGRPGGLDQPKGCNQPLPSHRPAPRYDAGRAVPTIEQLVRTLSATPPVQAYGTQLVAIFTINSQNTS